MKKLVLWISLGPACTVTIAFLCWFAILYFMDYPCKVTTTPISVKMNTLENANACQKNSAVCMVSANGDIYYFVEGWAGLGKRGKFDNKLCSIDNGEITALAGETRYFGKDNTYIYYQNGMKLCAIDTKAKDIIEITSFASDGWHDSAMDSEGKLYIMADKNEKLVYVIKDAKLVDQVSNMQLPVKEYQIGNKIYQVKYTGASTYKLYCDSEDITDQLGIADFRALVPYNDGLLLINDGHGNLVYFIDADGEIHTIFPEFECMCSTSSVNFYDNYVFVSFKRWESYDSGIGVKSYENDTLEGTYRIDMTDGSVEKINDFCYDGMYIFDDTGIFCCDRNGDICKIDFDGNLLIQIVD